jgi:LPS O-antigen subunit length determinant protein (WzzB/FepE family)
MNEIQGPPSKSGRHDDEIELFELLQKLWGQRFIILFITFCGVFSAAGYAYLAPQKFESKAILTAPSITAFAPFLQDVRISSNSTVDVLGVALKLSDHVMVLLSRNLLAPATQMAFISENPSFADCASAIRQAGSKVVVSVACSDKGRSLLALNGYIEYASKITAQEFQSLMGVVGVESSIEARKLYSVESPPSTKAMPKKELILALGLVFGGMLGLSIALIRFMLDHRASQAA